jgi:Lipase (class 3)
VETLSLVLKRLVNCVLMHARVELGAATMHGLTHIFRYLVAIAFATLLLQVLPAAAQAQPAAAVECGGDSDNPLNILATPAGDCARYYAPYALQAAAAYESVAEFAGGDDVGVVLKRFNRFKAAEASVTAGIRRFLKAWRFQFGSDGDIGCVDESDADCKAALAKSRSSRLRRATAWLLGSAGPAYHVWGRTQRPYRRNDPCTEVSIAFRGTVGLSRRDWAANTDWATSYVYDTYYVNLQRNINGIIKKITNLPCYRSARSAAIEPQIVSVGHSLGGALAQFAALANTSEPRIAKVFAFNSSPITGSGHIDEATLAANRQGLEVDHISHVNEILRRAREWNLARSDCNPLVRTVGFQVFEGNSAKLHEINPLAEHIVKIAAKKDYQVPVRPAAANWNCIPRYQPPASDEDRLPATTPAPGMVNAPAGPVVMVAQAGSYKPTYRYAAATQYDVIPQYGTEWNGSAPSFARVRAPRNVRVPGARIAYDPNGLNATLAPIQGTYMYATEWNAATASLARPKHNTHARHFRLHKKNKAHMASS